MEVCRLKALYFDGELKYIKDYPMPEPAEDEALIKVQAAGISNMDIELMSRKKKFKGVPGHEFVGVVEKSPIASLKEKRVVGEIECSCSDCDMCRSGKEKHCKSKTVLGIQGRDGVMAEYVALPIKNLHVIPDIIAPYEAVFVNSIASCFRVLEQVHIDPASRVAIIGAGKLGLLMSQVISLTSAKLVVIGKYKKKLKIIDDMGINTMLDKDAKGESFDIVIDCSGKPEGFSMSRKIVEPMGIIVEKSTYFESCSLNISSLVSDEIMILGSGGGPFEPSIRALRKHLIDVSQIIDKRFPLERGVKAFDYASREDKLKVIVDVGTSPGAGLLGSESKEII